MAITNFPVLDDNTKLEAGLRVRSTRSNWRSVKPVMEQLVSSGDVDVSKVDWARTDLHPSGAKVWSIGRELGTDGFVGIPTAIQGSFDQFDGFLMLKVVTRHERDHYAVPARYKDTVLYGYDKMLTHGRRDDGKGDWVYSLPFHGLVMSEQEGRKFAFFFVIRISGGDTVVDIAVDKITVTRGREHYRVVAEPHFRKEAVSVNHILTDVEVGGLPIRLAIDEFLHNRMRLSKTGADARFAETADFVDEAKQQFLGGLVDLRKNK